MEKLLTDFIFQVTATVVGGVLLSFLYFITEDKLFQLPKLNGLWTLELLTKATSYNPYKDMKLTYLILLAQNGNGVIGTGEKIHEITNDGCQKSYTGANRTHVSIRGYVTKRYFSKDQIIIHISETGEQRKSSAVHSLITSNTNCFSGTFESTIANSKGLSTWRRGNGDYELSNKTINEIAR
jgi:hypothetical protein